MSTIGRYIGFSADPTPGGTPFDELTSGEVPAPDTFWPVTGFGNETGETVLNRDDLIVPARGSFGEEAFRQAPTVTVRGRLFTRQASKLGFLAQGKADSRTGTAPVASTHVLDALGFGDVALPAIFLHTYKDGLYERFAGCTLNNVTFSFPNDGDATFEAMFAALYRFPDNDAFPVPSGFDDVANDWIYKARDTSVYADDSLTPTAKVRGFTLAIDNQLRDPDFDAGKNVESTVVDGKEYRLWYPARRRLSTARTVTGTLQIQDVDPDAERSRDLRLAKKLEIESEGPLLASTPAVRELMRSTLYSAQYTGGGAGDATRDGDLQSEFNYRANIDPTNGNRDLRVEFIDDNHTAITI